MQATDQPVTTVGFLRLEQILRLAPIGKSTLWRMVAEERFPKPLRPSPFGPAITVWKADEVMAWIEKAGRA